MATKDEVLDDELSGLSADERAALEGDEDEVDALKEIAGVDESDVGDDTEDEDDEDQAPAEDEQSDEGEGDTADEGQADAGDDTEATATTAETADDETEDNPAFMPTYKVDPVENFADKMAELALQKSGLREKLNSGDLSIDEYEAQKDEIVSQEQALREQNLKFQIAQEQNAQNAKARWEWEQELFFKDKANALYSNNRLLMSALDTAIKDLANDPKNASRQGTWFLEEADRQVREAFNLGKPAAPAAKDEAPAKSKKSRSPDLSVVPKTLSGLPNAEVADTGSDEFSHLENLEGMALEKALAKLSPEDAAKYLGVAA